MSRNNFTTVEYRVIERLMTDKTLVQGAYTVNGRSYPLTDIKVIPRTYKASQWQSDDNLEVQGVVSSRNLANILEDGFVLNSYLDELKESDAAYYEETQTPYPMAMIRVVACREVEHHLMTIAGVSLELVTLYDLNGSKFTLLFSSEKQQKWLLSLSGKRITKHNFSALIKLINGHVLGRVRGYQASFRDDIMTINGATSLVSANETDGEFILEFQESSLVFKRDEIQKVDVVMMADSDGAFENQYTYLRCKLSTNVSIALLLEL